MDYSKICDNDIRDQMSWLDNTEIDNFANMECSHDDKKQNDDSSQDPFLSDMSSISTVSSNSSCEEYCTIDEQTQNDIKKLYEMESNFENSHNDPTKKLMEIIKDNYEKKSKILTVNNLDFGIFPSELTFYSWIETIFVVKSKISHVLNLPPCLQILKLDNCSLREIDGRSLPHTLRELSCRKNKITSVTDLPYGIERLILTDNILGHIDIVPVSMKYVDLGDNILTSINIQSPKVTTLIIDKNRTLTNLDFLLNNNSLEILRMEETPIEYINSISPRLIELHAANSSLKKINIDFPTKLTVLDVSNSLIDDLPKLPWCLEQLNVSGTPIKSIRNIPGMLSVLIIENTPSLYFTTEQESELISLMKANETKFYLHGVIKKIEDKLETIYVAEKQKTTDMRDYMEDTKTCSPTNYGSYQSGDHRNKRRGDDNSLPNPLLCDSGDYTNKRGLAEVPSPTAPIYGPSEVNFNKYDTVDTMEYDGYENLLTYGRRRNRGFIDDDNAFDIENFFPKRHSKTHVPLSPPKEKKVDYKRMDQTNPHFIIFKNRYEV